MDGTEGCAISNDYGKKMLSFILIFKLKNMLTTFLPRKRETQVFKHDQHTRDRPRFFDQVGHQTTNAYIGNKHFFTK